jgi:hypothetical protein
MAGDDVTGLVAEHPGELRFVFRRKQESRVHIELRSGRRESVDRLGVVDHVHLDRKAGIFASSGPEDLLREVIHVARHARIAHEPHLLGELGFDLLAQLGLVRGRQKDVGGSGLSASSRLARASVRGEPECEDENGCPAERGGAKHVVHGW